MTGFEPEYIFYHITVGTYFILYLIYEDFLNFVKCFKINSQLLKVFIFFKLFSFIFFFPFQLNNLPVKRKIILIVFDLILSCWKGLSHTKKPFQNNSVIWSKFDITRAKYIHHLISFDNWCYAIYKQSFSFLDNVDKNILTNFSSYTRYLQNIQK